MTNRFYDAVIVGGGPAGATAGYWLGKSDFDVLIIDKEEFPRSKLCGGILTFKSIDFLKQIFSETIASLRDNRVLDCYSDKFRVFFEDKLIATGTSNFPFHFVRRKVFDNYLLDSAKEEKVEVTEGERVVEIQSDNNVIRTESGERIKGKHIIAADGINSIIRNKLQLEGKIKLKNWSENLAVGFEIFLSDTELVEESHPTIYFGMVDWGYGWIFPNRDQLVIGMGGLVKKNNNLKNNFDKFTSFLNLTPENIESHPVPYGNFVRKPSYDNIYLAGDAAGFVDPLTGEGIFYAMKSGELVARAIQNTEKGKIQDSGAQYIKSVNEHIIPRLSRGKMIRSAIFHLPKKIQFYGFKLLLKFCKDRFVKMINGQ